MILPRPARWFLSGFVALLLGFTATTASFADDAVRIEELVAVEAGELPIIISAPHGGTREIPGVPPRKTDGLKGGGSGYVTARDTGTEELARAVVVAVEKRFGKKPYFVISQTHRKFIDPNRPTEIAFDSPGAKPVYERYHGTLDKYCREVLQKYRSGVLLDLHGQGSSASTVYRGTKNGLTVTGLRERFGEAAHTGPQSLFGLLKKGGWKVYPDPFDGTEQAGFTGGYITQTYGSSRGTGIDAMQLEFGADYRTPEAREKTASVLADALVAYAEHYLTVQAPAVAATPATAKAPVAKLEVALYADKGASSNVAEVLKALEADSRLAIKKVTADDIRKGALAGCQVLVHPGGSGSVQGKNLGEEGRKQVCDFVEAGGGYVGVCAGAYLATCDYDWSLRILDAKVIDRQHWNRGFGTVEISLSDRGRELLGTKEAKTSIYYHQGPLLAPAEDPKIPDFDRLATFETEIAKNGAPEGVMKGTSAIASGTYHQGRVFCFSPHPERTPGLEPLLVRAVMWAAGDGEKSTAGASTGAAK